VSRLNRRGRGLHEAKQGHSGRIEEEEKGKVEEYRRRRRRRK